MSSAFDDPGILLGDALEAFTQGVRRLATPRDGPDLKFKEAHDIFERLTTAPGTDTELRTQARMGVLMARIALNAADADLIAPWNALLTVVTPGNAGLIHATFNANAAAFDTHGRHERAAKFRESAERLRAIPQITPAIDAFEQMLVQISAPPQPPPSAPTTPRRRIVRASDDDANTGRAPLPW